MPRGRAADEAPRLSTSTAATAPQRPTAPRGARSPWSGRRGAHAPIAALAAIVVVLAHACDCAGAQAPAGTTSYLCTCECGVFVFGQPVEDQTRRTPRFEVCLRPADVPSSGLVYARDVVDLCDDVCERHVSAAVREVACVDRPDLCEQIVCSEQVCRGATNETRDVFVPEPTDGGARDPPPDDALLAFSFAPICDDPAPDAGLAACEEVPCAMEDVRRVPACGDGVLQRDEECDGDCTIIGVCPALVPQTHGVVRCRDDCTFDTSACVPLDEEAEERPDTSGCAAENDDALNEKVLDVLRGCSVVEPSVVGDCERPPTEPYCLVP